jgi:hypothetical protein
VLREIADGVHRPHRNVVLAVARFSCVSRPPAVVPYSVPMGALLSQYL